ncbi:MULTISPECIES: OB-fold-containig protein [unclassified Moorena]|uniref:OB-fold-containig protein n=1 Tax=unclassified Moorena TaxID=2683338 RepID=UPI0014012654|nr:MULTISPECIES: OB-fold-containig protein [unclassified Moorena]NEO13738.1 YqiJ family protein [Moorena sp. SIO3E8]NEQ02003.1 YqiJ family protein [Moorena sp. SIO3F7]
MLFNLANLPYWIFLGMGVLLFLLVIVSGGGDDDIDIDADVDLDVDLDVDADVGTDTDSDADGDLGGIQILGWLGIGKAPLILLLATDCSLLGLFGWMFNVMIGGVTGSIPTGFLAGVVSVMSLFLTLVTGGFISRPIGKIFASFGEDTSSDRFIGCHGTVSSATLPKENQGKIGQVDVLDPARNLVTVNATLPTWATVTPKRGNKVLVIDRHHHNYLVILKDSADQQAWLDNAY